MTEPYPLLVDGVYVATNWPGGCMGYGLPRPEPHLWAFSPPTAFFYIGPLHAPEAANEARH